jgi:hypothetical protein
MKSINYEAFIIFVTSTTLHVTLLLLLLLLVVVVVVVVVVVGAGYWLDKKEVGVRFPVGSIIFSFPRRPDWLWGPPSLLCNGYAGALSPGLKRPGREADHSPPSSTEVRKRGSVRPLPCAPPWRSA